MLGFLDPLILITIPVCLLFSLSKSFSSISIRNLKHVYIVSIVAGFLSFGYMLIGIISSYSEGNFLAPLALSFPLRDPPYSPPTSSPQNEQTEIRFFVSNNAGPSLASTAVVANISTSVFAVDDINKNGTLDLLLAEAKTL